MAAPPADPHFLALHPEMDADLAIRRLQINALAAHQRSMGRGDELVEMLERTVKQLERCHNRVQMLNTMLFGAGLVLLAVAVLQTLTSGGKVWSALLGTGGALATLASVFWTGPLDKVSSSVTDLVKLETAFLGYIRVIGEIDSFFQMQYLDIIGSSENGDRGTLATAISDTTTQMKEMMTATVELIDKHVDGPVESATELRKELAAVKDRLGALETPAGA